MAIGMDDPKFLARVKEKIERLTGEAIDLVLDEEDQLRLRVDLTTWPRKVTLGAAVLEYPGLARMGIEYAVASIRAGREVEPLEFQAILRRN
ncbi:MAG TPA: hypothetical protein VJA25_13335 [Dehalococcoidia bacterium]|nr:hypothetical protein [Dehalococcoidia bacterium]HLE82254.1 hypothetical protein [Dehalococcoidia bacterium]